MNLALVTLNSTSSLLSEVVLVISTGAGWSGPAGQRVIVYARNDRRRRHQLNPFINMK
jgi:hypothetical protein